MSFIVKILSYCPTGLKTLIHNDLYERVNNLSYDFDRLFINALFHIKVSSFNQSSR